MPNGPLATRSPADLKPFLAVETTQLLVVHDDALAPEQDVEPAIAEPPANGRKFTQPRFAPPHRQGGGCDSASMCDLLRALNTPAVR